MDESCNHLYCNSDDSDLVIHYCTGDGVCTRFVNTEFNAV